MSRPAGSQQPWQGLPLGLERTALQVAPDLLGAVLTSHVDADTVRVRLVEVEAYEGEADPGSHAYRGRTTRTEAMFAGAGHLYVYRHLGLHHCVNLVTGPAGRASAVLLRAGEVIAGHQIALARRLRSGVCRRPEDLARGPARLAVCLGLDAQHNGSRVGSAGGDLLDLHRPASSRPQADRVATGARVGVNGPGGDRGQFPWRFWIEGDRHVSDFRPGRPGPAGSSRRGR